MQSTTAKQIPLSTHLFQRSGYESSLNKKELVLHTESHIEILKPELILFVQAHSNYSTFYLSDGKRIVVSKTLGSFVSFLSKFDFIRCHQSFLVNTKSIRRIVKSKSMVLILSQKSEIPVSRRHRKQILELFQPTC
jgi:two-component system LytT family response regulator